jgi:hypothetical protein
MCVLGAYSPVTHDYDALAEGCLAKVVIVGLVKPAVEPRNL